MRYWVAGGWGVAALAGGQTRTHRDLDLAVDAGTLPACLQALASLGYVPETDWLPVRVEYAAPGELWVDVHPVTFDDAGHGRQHDLDGGHFDYPPEASASEASRTERSRACRRPSNVRSTPATNRARRISTIFACWQRSTSSPSGCWSSRAAAVIGLRNLRRLSQGQPQQPAAR